MGKKISTKTKYVINLGNYENVTLETWCEVDIDDYEGDEDEAIEEMKNTIVNVMAPDLEEIRGIAEDGSFVNALDDSHFPAKPKKRRRK